MGRCGSATDRNEPDKLSNYFHGTDSDHSQFLFLVQVMRPILFCADDFGMAPGINAGILELAHEGRLSAVSCMSRGRYCSRDAHDLAGIPVTTGLHLNMTEPLEGKEFYQPLSRLLLNCYSRRIDPRIITHEIELQLDAFEAAFGKAPDYVDGHEHVHQFPLIRDCLVDVLLRRYSGRLPWLRSTLPGKLSGIPLPYRMKAWLIGYLGANSLRNLASRFGFCMNARLLGVYDFTGGEKHYLELLENWLAGALANDLLMCHPAKTADPSAGHGQQRVAEYSVLSGKDFPGLLEHYGFFLSGDVIPRDE